MALPENSPKVAFRDSQSGQAIEARITAWTLPEAMTNPTRRLSLKQGMTPDQFPDWPGDSPKALKASQGFLPWKDSSRWRLWQVSAPGHATLPVLIAPGAAVPLKTVWLDPMPGKATGTPEFFCRAGQVCGHVLDAETHQPLPKAEVMETEIRISAPGHARQIWQHVNWQAGPHLLADLRPGRGEEKHSLKHPLAALPSGQVPRAWVQAKLSQLPSPRPKNTLPQGPDERPGGAIFMDPPDSIAVGFAADGGYCCGNNCAISQVFSLETYVQKGLDNEWISSWPADSLKAGSVPFRSYGAWHAIESPYTDYDICAGPCCQAFELTSYASTVNAASATRGILLELNGTLARSEYSAENNTWNDPNDGLSCTNTDLSCGDGFVGSPLNGWPCLADNSAGRGCFGHGRGMSQWGTYYHALDGENWAAIVSFAAWPQTLNAGTDFSIALSLDNRAGEANGAASFGPVLIGASLLNSSNDYSDPANDNAIMLSAFGQQNTGRPFHTDPAWTPGQYDLAVALWLDVDANGTITGDDWVLAFSAECRHPAGAR